MKTEHLQIMLLVATLSACAEFEMTPPVFIPDKVPEAQNTPNAAADSPVQNEQSSPGESAADNPFNPTEEEVSQPLQRAPDLPAGANELIDGVPVEQQEEQSTPCEGLSAQGRCDGHFAVWCDNGQEARTNCADRFNTTCGLVDAETGFFCLSNGQQGQASTPQQGAPQQSGCGSVDYLGYCDGDVAVWCNENNTLEQVDCSAHGGGCGWINDDDGYFCE
ncbi:MAG: hypothetical protein ACON3Z_16860 [Bradymonadia bacterium]